MVRQARWAVIGAVMAGALALGACSSEEPAPVSSAAPATSSSPTPTPTPTPTEDLTASPLSGRPGGAGKPVLVVKYDNTLNAQPHAGLSAADVVYVEEVEYGLTRLFAVFSSTLPQVVGPVRSARISDIDLLAMFGRPAFAYSGAQSRLRPVIARSSAYDVSGDKGPAGYYRERGRRAPYDFMGRPDQLLARAPKASIARSVGYEFAEEPPARGRSVKAVTVRYPASQAQFVWNPKDSAFDVRLNKQPAREASGGTQQATTVVVQYVTQYDSGYGDKFGGRTPREETIGTGKAMVLRDGKVWYATWSRPTAKDGTTFTLADGSVIPFAPGQVWVTLVNKKTPASVS